MSLRLLQNQNQWKVRYRLCFVAWSCGEVVEENEYHNYYSYIMQQIIIWYVFLGVGLPTYTKVIGPRFQKVEYIIFKWGNCYCSAVI